MAAKPHLCPVYLLLMLTLRKIAAHLFSLDGYVWHTTPVQPYSTQVSLSDGTALTVSTRERPKFYFDEQGRPTHLFNGVSALPSCWQSDLDSIIARPATLRHRYDTADNHADTSRSPLSTPAFPAAAVGWQRFLKHCMSEQQCTSGCTISYQETFTSPIVFPKWQD